MKKLIIAALVSSLFACGGGGSSDDNQQPGPGEVIPPPEFVPPPAVEGGELPEIGVDYEQPAEDGGELPEIGVDYEQPAEDGGNVPNNGITPEIIQRMTGQIIKVKEATDNTFFFGVLEREIGQTVAPQTKADIKDSDLVWFYSADYTGNTVVYPYSMTYEQIRGLPRFTPTFSANYVQPVDEFCKPLMEGGEFCVNLKHESSITVHPAQIGRIDKWDGEKVQINKISFPVSQVFEDHLIETGRSDAMLFKDGSGSYYMVALPVYNGMAAVLTTVHGVDIESAVMYYTGDDGEIEITAIKQNEMRGIEDGDTVWIMGYSQDAGNNSFMAYQVVKVDLPKQ